MLSSTAMYSGVAKSPSDSVGQNTQIDNSEGVPPDLIDQVKAEFAKLAVKTCEGFYNECRDNPDGDVCKKFIEFHLGGDKPKPE